MKISKVKSGVVIILLAALLMACPGVQVKPSAEVSKYEGKFVTVHPVKVVGKAVGIDNPSYTNTIGDKYAGEFVADRTVTISPFTIAETELTYGLWKDVRDWGAGNGYFMTLGRCGSHGGDDANQPVTMVSWQDAIVWCNAYTEMKAAEAKEAISNIKKGREIPEDIKADAQLKPVYLSSNGGKVLKDATKVNEPYWDKDAKGFRLPTSVEWEYAARFQGDDKTNAVKLGDKYFTKLDSFAGAKANHTDQEASKEVAWYEVNSDGKTHPVAMKEANYLGLYDMSGNVWEWMYDGVATPKAGDDTDPVAPFATNTRVFRGGDWSHGPHYLCVGFRWAGLEIYFMNDDFGFRLVRSI